MSVTSPASGIGRGIMKIFGLTKQTSKNDLDLETVKSNTDNLPPIYFMDDTSVTLDRKKLQEKYKDQDILVMVRYLICCLRACPFWWNWQTRCCGLSFTETDCR